MTIFYQPLQRERDKRWDMTACSGSTPTHAIGYCAGWREYTREELEKTWGSDSALVNQILRDQEERRKDKDKYHSDGHETAEDAQHCYDTYLLDTGLVFGRSETEQHKCEVCGAWGQNTAYVRGDCLTPLHWLCDEHANRQDYEPIFRGRYRRKR